MSLTRRTPQRAAQFEPGEPESGYYNDLRPHVAAYAADVTEAQAAVARLVGRRETANPVTIAQFGLGAWQAARDDERWLPALADVAAWLVGELEAAQGLAYRFPLRHTYRLSAPWLSAMAQGEAASLLVRAAGSLGRPELLEAAAEAVRPLLEGEGGIVSPTPEGPVLEEYPTSPPAHVLNGWIYALWGLYDVAHAPHPNLRAAALFEQSAAALAARLPRYELPGRWSRYDLYPHPLPNVASPFYHVLHVEQLRALERLAPDPAFASFAERWRRSAASPWILPAALAGKVAFRLVRPRRRAAA